MVSTRRLPGRGWRLPAATALLLAALSLAQCKPDRSSELLGAWQAELLVEEGDTVDVRLGDVGLRFEADGSYFYTSTLDYEETGTYRLEGDYLYRQPAGTTADNRPVEIGLLTSQQLHLNMQDSGKLRRLEFSRIDDPEGPSDGEPYDEHDHEHGDHDHSDHEH